MNTNERITEIEQTLAVLWTARIAAYRAHNDVGHDFLCRAIGHLNAEMSALLGDWQ